VDGTQTTKDLLITIKTKYTLSEAQENTIDSWGHENE
jgi:hypothetical protein